MTSRAPRRPSLSLRLCRRSSGCSARASDQRRPRPTTATRATTCRRISRWSTAPSTLERDGQASPRTRTSRCSPAIGCAPSADARRSCSATAARSTSTNDTSVDLLSDSLIRLRDRPRCACRSRASATRPRLSRRRRRLLRPDSQRRRLPRLPFRSARGRCPKSISPCSAARRSSSNAARPHARARRPACLRRAATPSRRLPPSVQLRGRRRLRSLGRGPARRAHRHDLRRSTCPLRCALRRRVRSLRHLGLRARRTARLVSAA